ncbi:MAG TPA: glycosyltransferase family 4 protein [Opitutaceae bacterium]
MANILFLCGSDPWTQASGYFLYSVRCVEMLARTQGVCAASLYRPQPDRLVPPPNIKRVWLAERRLDSRVQRMRSLFGGASFCEREFNYPGVRDWVKGMFDREKPDLVVFNHIRAAWLAPLLGQLGVPTLYIAHNAEGMSYASIAQLESNPAGKLFALLEGRKLHRLEKRILDTVDSVIALTEEDRDRLQILRPGLPMHVVPPCFDVPTGRAPAGPGNGVILIVGSFHWRPKRTNVIWFLRHVYQPLRKLRPGLRCLIVGANANALRPAIAAGDGVELHADVPSVEPYLSQPAIFVTPERQWGGVKLKTCEAAAYGHPIVSTTPGMEGTGLRNGESCLVANTAEELQAAVVRCLDDHPFAEELGRRARLVAQDRFSYRNVSDNLNAAINAALSAKTA